MDRRGGLIDISGPSYVRRRGLEPYNIGRMTLRNILMFSLRQEASQACVIVEDSEKSWGFVWGFLLLRLERGEHRSGPIAFDALASHLATLPSTFIAHLQELLDDRDREFEPTNDLAHKQAEWFRSVGAVRRQVQIEIEPLKITFTFSEPPDS